MSILPHHFLGKLCQVLVGCLIGLGSASAHPWSQRVWVTMGEPAYQLLRAIDGDATSILQTEMANGLHDARGNLETITVRLVSVPRDEIDQLSASIHRNLHHCGGFRAHDSFKAAIASLAPRPAGRATVPEYDISHQSELVPWIGQVDGEEIEGTIRYLAGFHNRYYDSESGSAASTWLASHWREMAAGRSDITVEQDYGGGYQQSSVILTIEGQVAPEQVVVLGGHLDSVNWFDGGEVAYRRAPGADDDASGIAGITEVLRVLLANDYRPARTVQFMAYAAEEVGLLGSGFIAQAYARNNVDVVGVLQLDMTLYKGSEADIYLIDDLTSAEQNQFLADLAAEYLPDVEVAYNSCGYTCSDHASWHQQGYRASFPFEARISPPEDNPKIHSRLDTFGNAGGNTEHAKKFTRLALAYVVELADSGTTRNFAPAYLSPAYPTPSRQEPKKRH